MEDSGEGFCVAAVQITISQVCGCGVCCVGRGATHGCSGMSQGTRSVGIALLQSRQRSSRSDLKRFKFMVSEFQDTNQYSNLESALVRWQPTELSYPGGALPECARLCGVVHSSTGDSCETMCE